METWLRGLAATIVSPPKAILIISAHWEEEEFTLTSGLKPTLIYDYYGFPEHTYRLKYPADGAPEIAQEATRLLTESGIKTRHDAMRGLDHGVFIPLLLIYPQAQIPVLQLSLKRGLDPAVHIRVGKALAPLREQGVLMLGSGMSYHNLRRFGPQAAAVSGIFDDWLTRAACAPNTEERDTALANWHKAPSAREAHPREEHLLPLMVISGAAGTDKGRQVFGDRVMGMAISAYRY